MFSKRKWLPVLAATIGTFLVISGCSGSDDSGTDNGEAEESELTQEKQTEEDNAESAVDALESDQDLAEELEAEEGIESVMVQVVEGEHNAVNVDIEISEEMELSADELIDEYRERIAEKYPERTIDIIVVKDGELLEQVTIE